MIADDDRLVAHRRDIGAACGAAAHHAGDLRDAPRRHIGLVEKNTSEMVAIGEYLILMRQVGAAAVDQVDAWQAVFGRAFLSAQLLFTG